VVAERDPRGRGAGLTGRDAGRGAGGGGGGAATGLGFFFLGGPEASSSSYDGVSLLSSSPTVSRLSEAVDG
jgi:hypothetical protein